MDMNNTTLEITISKFFIKQARLYVRKSTIFAMNVCYIAVFMNSLQSWQLQTGM